MPRTIAVVQARLGSQRLPRKVLAPILGKPMLSHVVYRAQQMKTVDEVVVATDGDSFEGLLKWAVEERVSLYNGDAEPLRRYVEVAEARDLSDSDYIVRITGDCPGLDPEVSDRVVRLALEHDLPYACNLRDWPDGLDTEAVQVWFLRECNEKAVAGGDREHVTPWIRREVGCSLMPYHWELPLDPPMRDLKFSVDNEWELELVREMALAYGKDWSWKEILGGDTGRICELCQKGYRHLNRAGKMIWDLHEKPVPDGRVFEQCEAYAMWECKHRMLGQEIETLDQRLRDPA